MDEASFLSQFEELTANASLSEATGRSFLNTENEFQDYNYNVADLKSDEQFVDVQMSLHPSTSLEHDRKDIKNVYKYSNDNIENNNNYYNPFLSPVSSFPSSTLYPLLFSSSALPRVNFAWESAFSKLLPWGFLFTPCETNEFTKVYLNSFIRCNVCEAFPSKHYVRNTLLDGEQWKCLYCQNTNFINSTLQQQWSKICDNEDIEYSILEDSPPHSSSSTTANVISSSYESNAKTIIWVLDENFDNCYLHCIADALKALPLSSTTRHCLVSFWRSVAIHCLDSPSDVLSSHMIPGDITDITRKEIVSFLKFLSYDDNFVIGEGQNGVSALLRYIEALYCTSDIFFSKERAMTAAVSVALTLAEHFNTTPVQIIILTSGLPTIGTGSIFQRIYSIAQNEYDNDEMKQKQIEKEQEIYKKLSNQAFQTNTTISVVCLGSEPFALPFLSLLSTNSGGQSILLTDSDLNINISSKEDDANTESTHVSDRLISDLSFILCDSNGIKAFLELRVPANVLLQRIIGPNIHLIGEPISSKHCDNNKYLIYSFQLLSFNTNETYTFYFEIDDDDENISQQQKEDEYVNFQFTFRFQSSSNERILRVMSRQIPVISSIKHLRKSIDSRVTAIMISKLFVLKSLHAKTRLELTNICNDVKLMVRDLFLNLNEDININTNGITTQRLPIKYEIMTYTLYNLLRGSSSLLSSFGDSDVITTQRIFYIHGNLESCFRLVIPLLYICRIKLFNNNLMKTPQNDEEFELIEIPLTIFVLQSNFVFLLDCGTRILIWQGSEVNNDDTRLLYCYSKAQFLSSNRFPSSTIIICHENSSESRWILARLIPSNRDNYYDQSYVFDFLEETILNRKKMIQSLIFQTDELSYFEFLHLVSTNK